MTDYGVTTTGFVRERLAEIRAEIIAALTNNLQTAGLSGDIETRPDSVLGILIDTFAEREAALWELSEGVYSAMYPSTASGVNLDAAVSFTGVSRRGATKSRGYVVLYGDSGTTVPAGSQLENSATSEIWEIVEDTRISRSNAADVTLVLANSASAGTYTVYIDGVAYSHVAASDATTASIVSGLAEAITDASVTVTAGDSSIRLLAAAGSGFPLGTSSNLSFSYLGTPALAETVSASTLGADVGTLTTILNSVDGWTSVNNLAAAVAGSAAESDSTLRNRYSMGMYALGGATLSAVKAHLLDEVTGISNVVAFENTSDYADTIGRPPHSIHVIVEGGLDNEIAESIYAAKAAGIDTFGSTSVGVTNTEGLQTVINFDRPVPVYTWMKVNITLLDAGEQAFPDAGLEQIQDALVSRGQELSTGDDVVWQSFFRAVYSVSGVAYAELKFATSETPDATPGETDYQAANITIQPQQRAMFAVSRIEVSNGS